MKAVLELAFYGYRGLAEIDANISSKLWRLKSFRSISA